jgi:hypothetical protein
MKRSKWDVLWVGLVAGLLSPVLGFVVFGALWTYYNGFRFSYFVNDIFLNKPEFQSAILSVSLLMNLAPFFFAIQKHQYYFARGVLMALFIYVPVVIYLRFYY